MFQYSQTKMCPGRKNVSILSYCIESEFTELLKNCNSFVSFTFKNGLIKILIDRIYILNNTWVGFPIELKDILQKANTNLN